MGSQLEEARKKKGVSLREAAEATKIRMEYLSQFEADDFDIPLPPIYQRGFVKIYARYLGEDAGWYASEIQARLNRKQAMQTKGDVRASLGQMDLASRRRRAPAEVPSEGAAPQEADAPAKSRWKIPQIRMPGLHSGRTSTDPEYDDFEETGEPLDRSFYLKVAVVVGSVTVAVILLIALLKLILAGGNEDETPLNPELSGGGASAEIVETGQPADEEVSREMILRATDGPTYVQVKDSGSGEVLGQFSLSPGESRTVSGDGEVVILYTQGEFLEVQRGGETYAPARSGTGKIRIQ